VQRSRGLAEVCYKPGEQLEEGIDMFSPAQRWLFAIFSLCLWFGAALAEECPPEKFLLNESTQLLATNQIRLAFVERMDKSSFENAQKAEKNGLSLPINGVPISAYRNVDEAKQAGRKESQERQFNYDQDQSYWLLRNEVSKAGGEKYTDCINNLSAGVHASLVSQEGHIYKMALRLRNLTEFNWKKPSLVGFVMTSPAPKGKLDPTHIHTFLFRRVSEDEGSIELFVGSDGDSVTFPPVLKLVELRPERTVYHSAKMAYATSVGQDGHQHGKRCEDAPKGWHFVKGTEQDEPKQGTDGGEAGGFSNFEISPLIACINNWAYTGDKRVRRTREDGFAIEIERLVPVGAPTAASVNAKKVKNTSSGSDTKKP
jgi:hypothetical protein